MILVLDYWHGLWQSVAYETATGKGRVRWFRSSATPSDGQAARQWWRWYALWSTGETLVFQAGRTRWPIDENTECANVRTGSRRRFTLARYGTVVFTIDYRARDCDWDITFDEMDLEAVDFLYWTVTVCKSPKQQRAFLAAFTPHPEACPDLRRPSGS